MTTFFWLTLVGSVLALLYSLSRGDNDPWAWAKVVLAAVIMTFLIIVKCTTGKDYLDDEVSPSNHNGNYPTYDPSKPFDPFKDQRRQWQEGLGSEVLDSSVNIE